MGELWNWESKFLNVTKISGMDEFSFFHVCAILSVFTRQWWSFLLNLNRKLYHYWVKDTWRCTKNWLVFCWTTGMYCSISDLTSRFMLRVSHMFYWDDQTSNFCLLTKIIGQKETADLHLWRFTIARSLNNDPFTLSSMGYYKWLTCASSLGLFSRWKHWTDHRNSPSSNLTMNAERINRSLPV